MHPRNRGPWENSEVAAAINAKGTGATCFPTYLWHLRNGTYTPWRSSFTYPSTPSSGHPRKQPRSTPAAA
jgi:hypothetical protein